MCVITVTIPIYGGGVGMGGVGMGMPYGGYGAVPVVPVVVPNYGQYGYPY